MKTGNTAMSRKNEARAKEPQWSPVMKTGNTCLLSSCRRGHVLPQWSPVMKTGNTGDPKRKPRIIRRGPQWSPVMKTGNTGPVDAPVEDASAASMEPGHEDREYGPPQRATSA